MSTRVAVIGAGPCGLSTLRAYQQAQAKGADIPEVVCFEKQDDWGGLWHYTWRTGTDQHGEPVHGSMYRYLWSNGPKECLEFADYSFDQHFGQPIPSFPPRVVLEDYILGRAKDAGVRDLIRFNTAVRWVQHDEGSGKFNVVSEELGSDKVNYEQFDYVIVCTGHFSVPHIPSFDGIESFPGRVMHGHDFRSADEFTGKDLLVIGASYSAEDIGLQCKKYGANSVTMTWRTNPMGFKWPEGMDERPLLTKIDGSTCHFSDGSSKDIDAIIMCTGYLHHFPFMEEGLRLKTGNRLYPPGLYKGVVWESNPKVMYIGMQDQYYTFSMFDVQAWYARDVTMGRIELPSAEDMAKDSGAWVAREEALEDPYQEITFQTDYCKDLHAAVDYPAVDWDLKDKNFVDWEHDKEASIVGYRNSAFPSAITGTKAPEHHTEWWQAMDDSMEDFMKAK